MEEKFAKWTGFSVDIEACGPIPGDFSMTEIGIVRIDADLDKTYYSSIRMLNHNFSLGAITSIGTTYEKIRSYDKDPKVVMEEISDFIKENTVEGTRPMFFSDNNGFDWMFFNWYMVHFLGEKGNPFGHTSRNISDIYRGLNGNVRDSFKHLRMTKHTHNPVDDAMGNAEAIVTMVEKKGLKGLNIEI